MPDPIQTNANVVVDANKPIVPEVDLAAKLSETESRLSKMTEDRDNYRKVALSKKGKSPDDGGETEDERIARIVQEQLYDSKIGEISREKDEIIKKAVQENNELKVALKNRSQVGASAGQGANQEKLESTTEYWTEEQKSGLKKVYDNLPAGKKVSFEQFLEQAKTNYLKIKQN